MKKTKGSKMTQFEKVKQFSTAVLKAKGQEVQQFATPMNLGDVKHCIEMVLDEMVELLSTVTDQRDRWRILVDILCKIDVRDDLTMPKTKFECIKGQTDAIVDAKYFLDDCAARKAFPIDEFFGSVSGANLRKIVNGVVIMEGDKVQKPEGWVSPDKEQEEITARAMGINV